MASVEFITKRIEGKEKEIAKLTKKMERIIKAQESNWEDNPYCYGERDLIATQKDMEKATAKLEEYKAQLAEAQEKEDSRNVAVIIEFLNNWKANGMEFFKSMVPEYNKALRRYFDADNQYCEWFNTRRRNSTLAEREAMGKAHREEKEAFRNTWGWIMPYMERDTLNTEKLQKDLDREADRKYDFIIERTNAIVGQITSADELVISDNGELNGFIKGTNGTAKVQTIGAGGYNIQKFHFRTLVSKKK